MSPNEIHDDFIKTLGDESPSYSMVKKWAAGFTRGREGVVEYERSGCPKEATRDENVEHSLIMCCRRRSLRDIARRICIRFGAIQSILTDILGMSKVSAIWILRMLIKVQKTSRLGISMYLLSLYEDCPEEFMRRVVTQDETWVHHFDPEAKKQSMQWKHSGSHPLKKFKRVSSTGKVMASIVLDGRYHAGLS